MLYKLHINQDEIAVIDEAMKEHIALMDLEAPRAAAESAAEKVKLLREFIDLGAVVREAVLAKDSALQRYKDFTFKGKKPTADADEPVL